MCFSVPLLLVFILSVTLEVNGKLNRNPILVLIQSHIKNDIDKCRENLNNVIDVPYRKQSINQVIKYLLANIFTRSNTHKNYLGTCKEGNVKAKKLKHGRFDNEEEKENLICEPVVKKRKPRILSYWRYPHRTIKTVNDECY